ncbi:hypothetical protein [Pseudothermotoga thermarum]|uniref:hypothetical protein n=1 Tax=Pseudothermotoga thermarum TaxID=119394 RepID=UPI00145F01E9|nr:hypothetical protein [Pseudothermotoga thermarum]
MIFVRIDSYQVDMKSEYYFQSVYEKKEQLQLWLSKREIEPQTQQTLEKPVATEKPNASLKIKLDEKNELKLRIIKMLLEKFTGRKVRLLVLELKDKEDGEADDTERTTAVASVNKPKLYEYGFGLIYNKSESYSEQEQVSFETKGVITTKDGRRIEFSLNFHMSRSFAYNENFELRLGEALKDPLVLNFEGSHVEFSDKIVKLDITLDGILDEFKFVSENSGFLVLDLNNNGVVDDGRELFGPTTGSGFKELAVYDSDKNGWIDEADPIFFKLKIWSLDENGEPKLFNLLEKNVGAIYLGFVRTGFDVYDSEQFVGRLQNSGVFLSENGKPGTVQQVDLRV